MIDICGHIGYHASLKDGLTNGIMEEKLRTEYQDIKGAMLTYSSGGNRTIGRKLQRIAVFIYKLRPASRVIEYSNLFLVHKPLADAQWYEQVSKYPFANYFTFL